MVHVWVGWEIYVAGIYNISLFAFSLSHTHTSTNTPSPSLMRAELDHGLSEPQIRCITHQMLQALECLHAKGCIHRDLKAGNVLLCPDGSIRLGELSVCV